MAAKTGQTPKYKPSILRLISILLGIVFFFIGLLSFNIIPYIGNPKVWLGFTVGGPLLSVLGLLMLYFPIWWPILVTSVKNNIKSLKNMFKSETEDSTKE